MTLCCFVQISTMVDVHERCGPKWRKIAAAVGHDLSGEQCSQKWHDVFERDDSSSSEQRSSLKSDRHRGKTAAAAAATQKPSSVSRKRIIQSDEEEAEEDHTKSSKHKVVWDDAMVS